MKLLNKLERKLGRYAIHNLMKYVVVLFGLGLVIGTFTPGVYDVFLSLNFQKLMEGQVWRLITYIIPESSIMGMGILLTAISVYVYYMIGTALERAWGAFRFNLYFFSGIIFNILASLITVLITGYSNIPFGSPLDFICGTMFFAFAAIYPDTQFMIYFLIPVKAKWLAIIEGIYYIFIVFSNIVVGNFLGVLPLIVSFANFLIFFFATRNYRRMSPGEVHRKARYRKQMKEAKMQGNVTQFRGHNVITRHKCAVCGRTELDDDQLEFRFCSKCDGNYEYCMDHLFTHEHVKR